MTEKASIENVSLTKAQALLETVDPTRVRPIRKWKVNQYARDMLAGRWYVQDPIIVNELGRMVEGNHRMRAMVLAATDGSAPYPAQPDLTVRFNFLHGFPATMEAEDTIDTGMPRKYQDVLGIRGVPNSTLVASLARRLLAWEQGIYSVTGGRAGRAGSLSFTELDAYLDKHEDELVEAASYATVRFKDAHLSPTTLAMARIILMGKDAELADTFLSSLADGGNPQEKDQIWKLRHRLERLDWEQGRNRNTQNSQAVRLALLFIAWNHVRDGKNPALMMPKGGVTNKNYPLPH